VKVTKILSKKACIFRLFYWTNEITDEICKDDENFTRMRNLMIAK